MKRNEDVYTTQSRSCNALPWKIIKKMKWMREELSGKSE